MMASIRKLLRSRTGGSAAEFALVLPVLVLFLLGMVDVGRLMWTWNQAEKATQMGARYAVVTGPVFTNLVTKSFTDPNPGLTQGDPIPATGYQTATCVKNLGSAIATCTLSGAGYNWGGSATVDTTAFDGIATRMRYFFPAVTPDKVIVEYSPTDLGYAGDPNGADVAPLVTVSLRNIGFQPFLFQLFGTIPINLPDFRASLTLEDGAGTQSN